MGDEIDNSSYMHMLYHPLKDTVIYSRGRSIHEYDFYNQTDDAVGDLETELSANIVGLFHSLIEGYLHVVDEATQCYHRLNIQNDYGQFDYCYEVFPFAVGNAVLLTPLSNSTHFIYDTYSTVWRITKRANNTLFEMEFGYVWENAPVNSMSVDPSMTYLYLSTVEGVWKLSYGIAGPEMLLRSSNISRDDKISDASIVVPGELMFVDENVSLVIERKTQRLKVMRLNANYMTSICEAHTGNESVEGRISSCKLLEPQFIAGQPSENTSEILIGGKELYSLRYTETITTTTTSTTTAAAGKYACMYVC